MDMAVAVHWFSVFATSHPLSCLILPLNYLQCSSGPLSTSLPLVHQRPLSDMLCHTFIHMERWWDAVMYCNFFLKDAWGGVNVRILSPKRWILLQHKPVHEIMQSGFQFQCCLSLLDHVRVISLILPLACISASQQKQKYVLHHSHWVRVFWLPVKKCEANSSSPMPGFTQYMIHSTGKYCELTHLLSVTVNSSHSFLHTVHAHTVYYIYKTKYMQHTFVTMSELWVLFVLARHRSCPINWDSINVRLEGVQQYGICVGAWNLSAGQ